MSSVDTDELDNLTVEGTLASSRVFSPKRKSEQYALEDESSSESKAKQIEYRQWSIGPNDTFRPAGPTQNIIPAGVYRIELDPYGIVFQKIKVLTDDLSPLPDTTNERVLKGMRKFWSRKEHYVKHGLIYKRGVILYGPPGGGKTATVTMLSRDLIAEDGIVVFCENPAITSRGLEALRRIEPDRPIVCIEEDIDEMISRYGEHELLALLDGENQVQNVVHVATTNYPERLGSRIVNRPSRFDERIKVGMPSPAARRVYIEKVTADQISEEDRETWIRDTEGMSIAHIRELTAAVLCLDQSYDEVISRLRSMMKLKIKSDESVTTGFAPDNNC